MRFIMSENSFGGRKATPSASQKARRAAYKAERRKAAEIRQTVRDKRTDEEQLRVLDQRDAFRNAEMAKDPKYAFKPLCSKKERKKLETRIANRVQLKVESQDKTSPKKVPGKKNKQKNP